MFYRYVLSFFYFFVVVAVASFGIRLDNMDGFPFCKNFYICVSNAGKKGRGGCEKFFFSSLFILFLWDIYASLYDIV